MRRLLIALFAVASFCQIAQGATQSFMPENTLSDEDYLWSDGEYGINETIFNKVANDIYNIYKPIVKNLGGNLVMHLDWRDSTINAYADRNDGNWNISFFGGLARRKEIDKDGLGFALVVCHELAHHIASVPLYTGDDWAAIEGQSDQVGVQVCMQKYLAGTTKNVSSLSSYAVNKCKAAYSGQRLRECYNQMVAAKSCSDLLASLNREAVRFETPSKVVVRRTMESHPPAQCRLDTYVAGITCKKQWDDSVLPSWSDESKYNCERPRCWYAP